MARRADSSDKRIPVIDLFAGPGGLGEGFSAPSEIGGTGAFRTAISIEKDPVARQTLRLRSLYRKYPYGEAPSFYYDVLRGDRLPQSLFEPALCTPEAAAADEEAWEATLGVEPDAEVRRRVRQQVRHPGESVVIGGPPCQAYSLVGRSRNRGNPDYRPENDSRHTLYREYLKVLAFEWPMVFVMENVKGLLSASLGGRSVLQRILEDVSAPRRALGSRQRAPKSQRYQLFALSQGADAQSGLWEAEQVGRQSFDTEAGDPRDFVVRCEEFGIPQARHRVILLGIREDILNGVPRTLTRGRPVSTHDAIQDLPKLRSGLTEHPDSRDAWLQVIGSALESAWFDEVCDRQAAVAEIMKAAVAAAGSLSNRGAEFLPRLGNAPKAHSEWYRDPQLLGVVNHRTRSHIDSDLHRYLFVSAFGAAHQRSPTLKDLPRALRPDHANIKAAVKGQMFGDRFRVQLRDSPSTTVTSHISKDGHYYIHPDPAQCRSLTVREAARLQTFPDNYFFCGGRTSQYQQVGNAVPPLLALQVSRVVASLLGAG